MESLWNLIKFFSCFDRYIRWRKNEKSNYYMRLCTTKNELFPFDFFCVILPLLAKAGKVEIQNRRYRAAPEKSFSLEKLGYGS